MWCGMAFTRNPQRIVMAQLYRFSLRSLDEKISELVQRFFDVAGDGEGLVREASGTPCQ